MSGGGLSFGIVGEILSEGRGVVSVVCLSFRHLDVGIILSGSGGRGVVQGVFVHEVLSGEVCQGGALL